MSEQSSFVYIITNLTNKVLYTGMTSDLAARIRSHRQKLVPGFTKKYNIYKLVYFEPTETRDAALFREKQIKGWVRAKKDKLIEKKNPLWKDLYNELF